MTETMAAQTPPPDESSGRTQQVNKGNAIVEPKGIEIKPKTLVWTARARKSRPQQHQAIIQKNNNASPQTKGN